MEPAQLAIRTYFTKLGLEAEIADLYLSLQAHGPQSISELARTSGVERTRIYRLIDHLMESNLIELETRHKRGVIKAAPITNLRILINQREEALKNMRDELELIEQALARNSVSNAVFRTQLYGSPEAIRNLLGRLLSAKDELLALETLPIQEYVSESIIARWKQEFERKELRMRQVTTTEQAWSAGLKNTASRLIPLNELPATNVYICNSSVIHIAEHDGTLYGMELTHGLSAQLNRQYFDLLWHRAGLSSTNS